MIGELSDQDLLLAGAIIYWCEGGKAKPHSGRNRVEMINSDPMVIELFLRFLAVAGVEGDRLRFQIQIHETADLEGAQRFWSELVGVEAGQFNRTGIKPVSRQTNRKNTGADYRGCLRIGVLRSAELYHQIAGWAHVAMSAAARGLRDDFGETRLMNDGAIVPSARLAPEDVDSGGLPDEARALRRRAVELRRAGWSRAAIGRALNLRDGAILGQLLRGEPPATEWLERASAWERIEEQAHELRAQGWGYRRISDRLAVPRWQVQAWLRESEEPGSPQAPEEDIRVEAMRKYWKERTARSGIESRLVSEAAAEQIGEMGLREILMAGALAYWCEGAKDKPYRLYERVRFINSDPLLVRAFLGFLRAAEVDRSRWSLRLHIHESGDLERARDFWMQETGLPRSAFAKDRIKRHVPKIVYSEERQQEYHGCLEVDVAKSADLYRRVEGWAIGAMVGERRAEERWREAAGTDPPTGTR
ncbi:hypothetical protein ACRB68_20700 [Actinomadura sp. RB68]|uniref:Uncharacterized protein n=2 Tax=Actinomadura macrotermitis TaxID=2585200 RepID=A0A7K0BS86_9ACTN|nr:hypothetical protein [Actinomadura macrotermitis]